MTDNQDGPLVYNHIPKTAGTSVREAVAETIGDNGVHHLLDHVVFGDFCDFGSIAPGLRRYIVDHPDELPEDPVFVTGHISPWTTRQRYPCARQLTALREPRARLVSNWLFTRAHTDFMARNWGTFDQWFRVSRLSLDSWLNSRETVPIVDNAMARFLAWPTALVPDNDFIDIRNDEAILAAAMTSLNAFDHVALVEDPDMMARLATWLGRDLRPKKHNEARPLPKHLRVDLAQEIEASKERIAHLTRLDAALWQEAASKVFPGADLGAIADEAYSRSISRAQSALEKSTPRLSVRPVLESLYMRYSKRRRPKTRDTR